ncbi:MAG: ATP-binding protein, partial [Acidimicrobiales bacterium]
MTITGPGGIGKTALGRAAAVEVSSEFEYGHVVVDLTRIEDESGVAEAVAMQLGCADYASLMNSPSDQPALIMLDNCEHILDAAANVVSELLDACRMPTILTTSRSPLDLPDESIITLAPLELPIEGAATDAASLRLLRTRAIDQGASLDPAENDELAEICRRVDGIPLAIEIAAARLRTRTTGEVVSELDARPHELARHRFRGHPNQRSVADMVGWSVDLLPPLAKDVFPVLGAFAGPFTLDMAVAAFAADDAGPIRAALD